MTDHSIDTTPVPQPPLHIRLRQGVGRFGEWNINSNYNHDNIRTYAQTGDFDYLVLCEPPRASKTRAGTEQYLRNTYLNAGYHLYHETHTHVLIRTNTLQTRLAYHTHIHDGRAQFHVFRGATPDDFLIVIGVYAYQASWHPSPDSNPEHTPETFQEDIFAKLDEIRSAFKYTNDIAVFGDLQASMDSSIRHRTNPESRARPKHDILTPFLDPPTSAHIPPPPGGAAPPPPLPQMYSAISRLHPDETCYTHYHDGGAGELDHGLVSRPLWQRVQAGAIETELSAEIGPADHDPIYLDIRLDTSSSDPSPTTVPAFKWRQITNIPLRLQGDQDVDTFKASEDATTWYEPDTTSSSLDLAEQIELFEELKLADASDSANKQYDTIQAALGNLEHLVKTSSTSNPSSTPFDRLLAMKTHADDAATKLLFAIEDILRSCDLDSTRTVGHHRKTKPHKKTPTLPTLASIEKRRKHISAYQHLSNLNQNLMGHTKTAHKHIARIRSEPNIAKRATLLLPLRTTLERLQSIANATVEAGKAFDLHCHEQRNKRTEAIRRSKGHGQTTKQDDKANRTFRSLPDKLAKLEAASVTAHAEREGRPTPWDPTKDEPPTHSITARTSHFAATPATLLAHLDAHGTSCTADKSLKKHLTKAADLLHKLQASANSTQATENQQRRDFHMRASNFGEICRLVNPPDRSPPEANTTFLVPSDTPGQLPTQKPANSITEMLQATDQGHSKQMAPPPGVNMLFWTLTEDAAGVNGAEFNDIDLTEENLATYLPALAESNDHELKRRVISAHRRIKPILAPADAADPAFEWKFKYDATKDSYTSTVHLDYLARRVMNPPSKARHGGFTLNVLARLPRRWFDAFTKLAHLCLAARIIPTPAKEVSRIPIPKPGSLTDRRPLSVCHDFAAFLSSVVQTELTLAIERSNKLPKYVKAYRPGVACEEMVIALLSMIEDVQHHKHVIAAQLDDDEEKFFDRITLEYQIASLKNIGCPDRGYVEWIAEDMQSVGVTIFTIQGIVRSQFLCGLKQGMGVSCPTASIVSSAKGRAWSIPVQHQFDRDNNPLNAYAFYDNPQSLVASDDLLLFCLSYCDDSQRLTSAPLDKYAELIQNVQEYIDFAGDLSLVTKLGRKASKCVVRIFNAPDGTPSVRLDPSMAPIDHVQPHEFTSTAWNYLAEYPTTNKIECIIQTTTPNEDPSHPSFDQDKHFGTQFDMFGNPSANGPRLSKAVNKRLQHIKRPAHSRELVTYTFNSVVASLVNYDVLCTQLTLKDATTMDKAVVANLARRYGLAQTDPKHTMFMHTKDLGFGLRSFTSNLYQSQARELEVWPNSTQHVTPMVQHNLDAALIPPYTSRNYCRHATKSIADIGIILCDARRPALSRAMHHLLAQDTKARPHIGHPDRPGTTHTAKTSHLFKDPDRHTSKHYHYGGTAHRHLQYLLEKLGDTPVTALSTMRLKKTPKGLPHSPRAYRDALEWALAQSITDTLWGTTFIEWRRTPFDPDPVKSTNFHTVNPSELPDSAAIRERLITSPNVTVDDLDALLRAALRYTMMDPDNFHPGYDPESATPANMLKSISDSELLALLAHYRSPLIVATDGGSHDSTDHPVATVALCAIDYRDRDKPGWTFDLATIVPLAIRTYTLPTRMGATPTDNNTAELQAMLAALELIPPHLAAITIYDSRVSESVVNALWRRNADGTQLRELDPGLSKAITDRKQIREIDAGISKSIARRAASHIASLPEDWEATDPIGMARVRDFIEDLSAYDGPKWTTAQCITAPTDGRPYVWIHSHQLTAAGQPKTNQPPIPCLPIARLNFYADWACSRATDRPTFERLLKRAGGNPAGVPGPHPATCPNPVLPHPSYPYVLIPRGKGTIDRSPTEWVKAAFHAELLHRHCLVPEFGLVSRILVRGPPLRDTFRLHSTTGITAMMLRHQGKAHTRAYFLDSTYKTLHDLTLNDPDNEGECLRCPFARCRKAYPHCRGNAIHFHGNCLHPLILEARSAANAEIHGYLHAYTVLESALLAAPATPTGTNFMVDALAKAMAAADAATPPPVGPVRPTRSWSCTADLEAWLRSTTPANHPLHSHVRNYPLAYAARLVPAPPNYGQPGFSGNTVDLLFIGHLPHTIHAAASQAMAAFRRKCRLRGGRRTDEALNKHIHALCDANPDSPLARLFQPRQQANAPPDSPPERPKLQTILTELWLHIKITLYLRTHWTQRTTSDSLRQYKSDLQKRFPKTDETQPQSDNDSDIEPVPMDPDPPQQAHQDDKAQPAETTGPAPTPTPTQQGLFGLAALPVTPASSHSRHGQARPTDYPCHADRCNVAVHQRQTRGTTRVPTKPCNSCKTHAKALTVAKDLEEAIATDPAIRLAIATIDPSASTTQRPALKRIIETHPRLKAALGRKPKSQRADRHTKAVTMLLTTLRLRRRENIPLDPDPTPNKALELASLAEAICFACTPHTSNTSPNPIFCTPCQALRVHTSTLNNPLTNACPTCSRPCHEANRHRMCRVCYLRLLTKTYSTASRWTALKEGTSQTQTTRARLQIPHDIRDHTTAPAGPRTKLGSTPKLAPHQLFQTSRQERHAIQHIWFKALRIHTAPDALHQNATVLDTNHYKLTYLDMLRLRLPVTRPPDPDEYTLNPSIMKACIALMKAGSPHMTDRHIYDISTANAVRQRPQGAPSLARSRRGARRQTPTALPHPRTQYILMLVNDPYPSPTPPYAPITQTRWTLQIRHKDPNAPAQYFIVDPLAPTTHSTSSEASSLWSHITPLTKHDPITSANTHLCLGTPQHYLHTWDNALHALQALYVFLYHPHPLSFDFTTLQHPPSTDRTEDVWNYESPAMATFRRFLAHSLHAYASEARTPMENVFHRPLSNAAMPDTQDIRQFMPEEPDTTNPPNDDASSTTDATDSDHTPLPDPGAGSGGDDSPSILSSSTQSDTSTSSSSADSDDSQPAAPALYAAVAAVGPNPMHRRARAQAAAIAVNPTGDDLATAAAAPEPNAADPNPNPQRRRRGRTTQQARRGATTRRRRRQAKDTQKDTPK